MFEGFREYIGRMVDLDERELEVLESHFIFRQVPRKFKLVNEDQVSDELYFIVKGLVRLYYTKDTEEITAFIFRENLFCSSYDSFLRRTPSIQTLETLEDCDLLVITKDKMDTLYDVLPKFNILARKVAEQRFINAQMILSSFILESPEERYRRFEANNKDLFLRVPHHHIASFLGITPVSLSRIRKRIKDENS